MQSVYTLQMNSSSVQYELNFAPLEVSVHAFQSGRLGSGHLGPVHKHAGTLKYHYFLHNFTVYALSRRIFIVAIDNTQEWVLGVE